MVRSSSSGVCSGAHCLGGCVWYRRSCLWGTICTTHTPPKQITTMCAHQMHVRLHAEASQVAPALSPCTLLHRVCLQPFGGLCRPVRQASLKGCCQMLLQAGREPSFRRGGGGGECGGAGGGEGGCVYLCSPPLFAQASTCQLLQLPLVALGCPLMSPSSSIPSWKGGC